MRPRKVFTPVYFVYDGEKGHKYHGTLTLDGIVFQWEVNNVTDPVHNAQEARKKLGLVVNVGGASVELNDDCYGSFVIIIQQFLTQTSVQGNYDIGLPMRRFIVGFARAKAEAAAG